MLWAGNKRTRQEKTQMFKKTKSWYFFFWLMMVLISSLGGEARAADKKVYVYFGEQEEVLTDRDTTGIGQEAHTLIMDTAVLIPTLPKAMTSNLYSS